MRPGPQLCNVGCVCDLWYPFLHVHGSCLPLAIAVDEVVRCHFQMFYFSDVWLLCCNTYCHLSYVVRFVSWLKHCNLSSVPLCTLVMSHWLYVLEPLRQTRADTHATMLGLILASRQNSSKVFCCSVSIDQVELSW